MAEREENRNNVEDDDYSEADGRPRGHLNAAKQVSSAVTPT